MEIGGGIYLCLHSSGIRTFDIVWMLLYPVHKRVGTEVNKYRIDQGRHANDAGTSRKGYRVNHRVVRNIKTGVPWLMVVPPDQVVSPDNPRLKSLEKGTVGRFCRSSMTTMFTVFRINDRMKSVCMDHEGNKGASGGNTHTTLMGLWE